MRKGIWHKKIFFHPSSFGIKGRVVSRFVCLFVSVCDFRKSLVCQPKSDDTLSSDEHCGTNKCLPLMTSDGHKAKVIRKSRKMRKQRALSFNCKQLSVSVQTEEGSSMIMPVMGQRPACDDRLVSVGTQTDDVIVISVSPKLHASSDVPDGLFKSGHNRLLPAIRTSDEHSASYDRDTDSGHMSDTENKLLLAVDCGSNEVKKDSAVRQSLSVVSVYNGSEETDEVAVLQSASQSTELVRHDTWQLNNSTTMQNKIPTAVVRKRSASESGPLSRWTTATRLDVLDENEGERISMHPDTFFAPLETSISQQSALNDVDMSGISVLTNHSESRLPLSPEILSVNSETKSSTSHLHSDVIVSSSSNQSQSSADIVHVSKQSCGETRPSNSSNGRTSRPSAGTHRRVSKGLRKPRLSVGRKSLSKSTAVRDKCHPTTKISRPAAWLMNATKPSRSKVLCHCILSFFQLNGNLLLQHLLTENFCC